MKTAGRSSLQAQITAITAVHPCDKMGKRFKKDSRAVSPLTFSETDATFKKANIIVKHVEKESTFVKALQRSSY